MVKTTQLTVGTKHISVMLGKKDDDFICLTDMVKSSEDKGRAADIIKNWLRNRATIEFLGTWETLYNPNFKVVEFDHFKQSAGLPTFTLSVSQWVKATNAIGIKSKQGRIGGGTYAHKDIAFEFGAAISPMFKLYLIKEYQRLKETESNPLIEQWDIKRILSKANYTLHTDAVQKYVIPKLTISEARQYIAYANEADMLNVALFGYTAKEWERANPELAAKRLNMRDTASINQLVVLSNMESFNSELIKQGVPREVRFNWLHRMAKEQIAILDKANTENKFRKISSQKKRNLLE